MPCGPLEEGARVGTEARVDEFKAEQTRAFFEHWRGLCSDDAVPDVQDYLDHILARVAPYLLMYDYSGDDLIARFQGTNIVQRWTKEITGQSWFTVNPYIPKALVLANCRDCLDYRCGVWGQSIYVTTSGREVPLENMMLPLRAKAGRPPRFVNISSLLEVMGEGEIGKARVVTRAMSWLDAGFGVPPHALRRSNAAR